MQIPVSLGKRSYTIAVTDSYRQLNAQLASLKLPRVGWVISHRNIILRHGSKLFDPLERAGWKLKKFTVPESESSKSFAMAMRVVDCLSREATKGVMVLFAFGGGVVGDLAGFVASIFHRGIQYVQLPTTLLAQVDSAIGGKVGVDTPRAKNLIGAFYQPRFVCSNISLLATLPIRQRRSGLAEVIKYGTISDRTLFSFLENHVEACLSFQLRAVRVMVERSCLIKAGMVSRDEREQLGIRTHLNFGHTLGHALEAASGYRRFTHGEAIAIGMCAAAQLSVEVGSCQIQDANRLTALVQAVGLPSRSTGVTLSPVLRALKYDKKFIRGKQRWVLLDRIGRATVNENVPVSLVKRVLAQYIG